MERPVWPLCRLGPRERGGANGRLGREAEEDRAAVEGLDAGRIAHGGHGELAVRRRPDLRAQRRQRGRRDGPDAMLAALGRAAGDAVAERTRHARHGQPPGAHPLLDVQVGRHRRLMRVLLCIRPCEDGAGVERRGAVPGPDIRDDRHVIAERHHAVAFAHENEIAGDPRHVGPGRREAFEQGPDGIGPDQDGQEQQDQGRAARS